VLLAICPPLVSFAMNLTLSSPVHPVSGVKYAVFPEKSIVMCFVSVVV